MSETASIVQEYYKLQEYWNNALRKKNWKLAIWVAQYPDIEIVSTFLDMEASALGETKEILLKFNSIFNTDPPSFTQDLWHEFQSWFDPDCDPRYDMHKALIEDGYLQESFTPNTNLKPTVENLISEIERFRLSLIGLDIDLIIEFNLGRHQEEIIKWMQSLLLLELPEKIRFVTIDIAKKRLYKGFRKKVEKLILEIHPELNMVSAMKSEMKKTTESNNPHHPDSKYKMIVLELMDILPDEKKITPLIEQLYIEAKKLGGSMIVSTHLIVAHVYNTIRDPKKGLEYIEQSLIDVEQIDEDEKYPLWRSCILFKSAFLFAMKKEDEALESYELLAQNASKQKDYFYIMEAYRLCASIKAKKKKYDVAFEHCLLGLYGGSFMDISMRRESTYVYIGNLAYNLLSHIDNQKKRKEVLEEHLEKWIGKDWKQKIHFEENLNNHYAPLPKNLESLVEVK